MKQIKKPHNIIDYISWLTFDKKKWCDLSYEEKKNFNVFIINRFLSMEYDFIEVINDLQELTCSMEKEMVWRLYYEMLPKSKIYFKFIKGIAKDLNLKEISAIREYFNCSEDIAIDYIELLKKKGLEKEINQIIEFTKKG